MGLFDGKHISVGEPFDAAFTLSSRDSALCHAWFDAPLRSAFHPVTLGTYGFQLTLRDNQVVAHVNTVFLIDAEIVRIAKLVAFAADGACAIAQRWQALGRALLGVHAESAEFPPPGMGLERQGCSIELQIARTDSNHPRWVTRLVFLSLRPRAPGETVPYAELPGIVIDAPVIEHAIARSLLASRDTDQGPYR